MAYQPKNEIDAITYAALNPGAGALETQARELTESGLETLETVLKGLLVTVDKIKVERGGLPRGQMLLQALGWQDGSAEDLQTVLLRAWGLAQFIQTHRLREPEASAPASLPLPHSLEAAIDKAETLDRLLMALLKEIMYRRYPEGAEALLTPLKPLGYDLCKKCNRRIVWVAMESGRTAPVDPDYIAPYESGNLVFDDGTSGKFHAQYPKAAGRVNHFITCPFAKDFKRR